MTNNWQLQWKSLISEGIIFRLSPIFLNKKKIIFFQWHPTHVFLYEMGISNWQIEHCMPGLSIGVTLFIAAEEELDVPPAIVETWLAEMVDMPLSLQLLPLFAELNLH